MGARGPVPNRSDQRRRRNKDEGLETAPAMGADAPEPDENWHPIAKRWFESLAESGQSSFYEPSDWSMAYLIAESISRDLKPQWVSFNEEAGESVYAAIPMKGASLSAYLKAMTALMVSEGDRRRAKLELQRGGESGSDDPEVPSLDEYRQRFAG